MNLFLILYASYWYVVLLDFVAQFARNISRRQNTCNLLNYLECNTFYSQFMAPDPDRRLEND